MSAVNKKIEHIIESQFKAEETFLAEYRRGTYTFEQPFAVENPYLISPLTALILFETEKEEAITVTVKGTEAYGDFHFTTKKERSHTIPVYGLYADADNTVILSDESGAESSVIIRTKPLPELVKRPAYVKENGPHMAEQLMFLSPTSDA